jgi:hypothetical protein
MSWPRLPSMAVHDAMVGVLVLEQGSKFRERNPKSKAMREFLLRGSVGYQSI